MRILIVEDEKEIADIMLKLLPYCIVLSISSRFI